MEDIFFDFRQLLKPYDFNFIKTNQHVFMDDCESYHRYPAMLYNDADFDLWIPYNNNIHQPDILRVYIKRKSDRLYIPVIVTENTQFNNLKEYGLDNNVVNELCCYLSNNYEKINRIKDGSSEKLIKLYQLIPVNVIIRDYRLSEAETLTPEQTGCSRCIWLDEHREVQHGPRIKIQHNLSKTNTRDWATLTITGKFLHDDNPDSKFGKRDRELLLKFVEVNKELIKKVFYGEETVTNFIEKCTVLDKEGNPVIREKLLDDSIVIINNIKDDMFICVRKKDSLYNVIYKDEYLFDEWFNLIVYETFKDRLKMTYDNWTKTKYHYFKK